MKHLTLWLTLLVALLLLLTALWLGADTLVPTPFTYFSFRTVSVSMPKAWMLMTDAIALPTHDSPWCLHRINTRWVSP